ncbi:MAG TPA: MGMT family protein [Vicinamibacteria bacterium]|nr:MGMT family protein [Vicinamibacteria bacterium]
MACAGERLVATAVSSTPTRALEILRRSVPAGIGQRVIAKACGSEARDAGRVMASNPLYPIVPCHRVVGADLSLVGCAGSRGKAALATKLARLSRERRGFEAPEDLRVDSRPLRVYPVEWAIAIAEKRGPAGDRQLTLFDT